MLTIGSTVLNVADVARAVAFWSAALDYVPRRDYPADATFVSLRPRAGAGIGLAVQRSESPPPEFPHVHLDLWAGDAADQAAEVDRLLDLGATRVDWPFYPEGADYIVLADPDGNRFCVINTTPG